MKKYIFGLAVIFVAYAYFSSSSMENGEPIDAPQLTSMDFLIDEIVVDFEKKFRNVDASVRIRNNGDGTYMMVPDYYTVQKNNGTYGGYESVKRYDYDGAIKHGFMSLYRSYVFKRGEESIYLPMDETSISTFYFKNSKDEYIQVKLKGYK